MRPLLTKSGALIEPASILEGARRRSLLERERSHIQQQLADAQRPEYTQYAESGSYERWRARAESALSQFTRELRKLDEWLQTQDAGKVLLERAYEVLQSLELRVNFDDGTEQLMDDLDSYFASQPQGGK